MTGEMTQNEADEDGQWEYHREIAKHLNGKVIAFDQYLGPQIMGIVEEEEKFFFATDLFEGKLSSDGKSCLQIELDCTDGEKYLYQKIGDQIVFGKIQVGDED
jgi:hypothetical protein